MANRVNRVNRFDAPKGMIAITRGPAGCLECALMDTCSPYPCSAEDRRDGQNVVFKHAKQFAILASYCDSEGRRFKHMYKPVSAENKRAAIAATIAHLRKSYHGIEILGAWNLSK